jgi:multiple sugar transport system permease protein
MAIGKGVVLGIIIAALFVPFDAIAIPLLLNVSKLLWIGVEGLTTDLIESIVVSGIKG